jgi:NADPH-dependent glutamate synthase beta subunit-like oxidoreductase
MFLKRTKKDYIIISICTGSVKPASIPCKRRHNVLSILEALKTKNKNNEYKKNTKNINHTTQKS